MNISDLTSQEGFSAFLHAYHQRLHDERSFPPLGVQKALHTASPIFGHENWQAFSASKGWNSSQTHNQSDETVALLIEYREDYVPFSDDLGFIEETDFKLFESASDACAYLHHLINLRNPLTLTSQQGREAEAATAQTSDYDLDKWAEFATFHLKATIQVKRQSSPDPKVETVTPVSAPEPGTEAVVDISFTVNYEGNHQSPHQSIYQTKGTKSEVNKFIANLICEDIGALDQIFKQMRDELRQPGHPLDYDALFNFLKRGFVNHSGDKFDLVTAITRVAERSSFGIKQFLFFFEAAAGVSTDINSFKLVAYNSPNGEYPVDSDVVDVANHVLEMQDQYGFSNDEDSVREAVEESANLLGIQLNELEIIQACDRVLGQ